MREALLASVIGAIATVSVHAQSSEIRALTKDLDCTSYLLTSSNQRIRLSSEDAIPSASVVWALVNEGPSQATVFVSKGDRMPVSVFDGRLSMFIGDARFSYTVGLSKSGTTHLHVCR